MSQQHSSSFRFFFFSFVFALFALLPAVHAQNTGNVDKNTRYVALGDSLAFGLDPTVDPPDLAKYIGYPKLVASTLHEKLANASCPGETSGHFLDLSQPDLPGPFGCAAWKAANNPMFIDYDVAQMDYTVKYLKTNPNADLITINIGGNDLGLLQFNCAGDMNCVLANLPATLAQLAQNLTRIYFKIRWQAGYRGKVVALTYYAFNYNDLPTVSVFIALNSVISSVSSAFNVAVADGFQAFYVASSGFGGDPCAAGLLAKDGSNGACGTHPTLQGQQVLADAVLDVLKTK